MESTELRRLLLIATVTALSVTALIAIVALLAGDFDDTQLRILATTGGFGLSSLIATRGTALLDQRRQLNLARAVIALAGIAFLAELWVLWVDSNSDVAWKSYVCAIAGAGGLGQIAGMIARRRPTDPPSMGGIVWGAGTCAAVLALMACYAALAEVDDAGYYQLFGVVAVLDVLGVILQPVLRRLGTPAAVSDRAAGPRAGKFVVVLADGRRIEHEAGQDLPSAVAGALRSAGGRVTRIELGDG
jgi:hypothetical protein